MGRRSKNPPLQKYQANLLNLINNNFDYKDITPDEYYSRLDINSRSVSAKLRRFKIRKVNLLDPGLLEVKRKLSTLYELYELIYVLSNFRFSKDTLIKNDKHLDEVLNFYDDIGCAELKDTWLLGIDRRIELHRNFYNYINGLYTS